VRRFCPRPLWRNFILFRFILTLPLTATYSRQGLRQRRNR
jgi:hypothetical protein